MGTRSGYAPGAFSWVDLATTDAGAAKKFYDALFGWELEDMDAAGASYTMARLDGAAVAGLYEMSAEARSAGAAPNWTSYVTVEDADGAATRCEELSGAVVDGTRDVMDLGRMTVLRDPHGAVFAVWQPGTRIGAERVNDVGCLCMNELATSDPEAARPFYEEMFGWETETIDTGPDGPPTVYAHNKGTLNASFGPVDGAPPHWRPYFTVDSVERASGRIRELGGTVLAEEEIPDGAIAVALDAQGAVFAIFEGEVDS